MVSFFDNKKQPIGLLNHGNNDFNAMCLSHFYKPVQLQFYNFTLPTRQLFSKQVIIPLKLSLIYVLVHVTLRRVFESPDDEEVEEFSAEELGRALD